MKYILPIFLILSSFNVGLGFSSHPNLKQEYYYTVNKSSSRSKMKYRNAPFFSTIEKQDEILLSDSSGRKTLQEYSTTLLTTDKSITKAKIIDIEALQSKSVNGTEIKEILDKLYDPKDFYAIILSLFIGLFSGCSVALFKLAVEKSSEIFYGPYSAYLPPYLIPLTGEKYVYK